MLAASHFSVMYTMYLSQCLWNLFFSWKNCSNSCNIHVNKSPKYLSQSLTVIDTRLALQPNAKVNNVPMDPVIGFRIEGKFAMSILWVSASIILRALRDKTKNQTSRNSQDRCSLAWLGCYSFLGPYFSLIRPYLYSNLTRVNVSGGFLQILGNCLHYMRQRFAAADGGAFMVDRWENTMV